MSMPQRHVLIVAQEIELRARIARVLQSAGHVVELAGSQTRALELAASKKIEAAIVVNSDELNGLGQALRKQVPRTIILGDRKGEICRSKHFPLGPEAPAQEFDEQKLLDQLKEFIALLGGAGDETSVRHPVLTIEDCRLDLAAHVFVDGNGREVTLSRAELKLLAVFTCSPRQVLSRDQLRRAVIGRGAGCADRSIDMLVARLRRKIEPNPKAPRLIVSVAGVGYKFVVRPQVADRGNPPPTIDQLNPSGLRNDTRATSPGQGIPAQDSEPERRHLTILSCKLVGAAALATTLDPEDFGNIVRSFQNVCTSVVTQWNGSITHSVGDEILASFGYPTSHEDDAERAVYAALDLVERAGGLLSPSGKALQVRSAIASGLIFINENRTPVGDAIVVAGQLRTITPPNSVTVSARTRKLLGRLFVCDGPQQCELEGVSEPVTWYRVAGKGTMQSRFESKRYEKLTQFVGRQYELQHLSTVWEGAKSGKGQVVLLCGEAGIGKSRICKAWLDSIATEPHITLCLQCSPYHVNSPFHPVIKHLEHAAGFERDDCPDLKLQKLEKLLCQTGATTLANSPLFATLLSIPSEGAFSSPNLTPQRQRDLTIAALRQQLLATALTRPVILKVADIHWADSSTLELLDRCIASVKTAHVVVVCTFRPEFFPRWLNESHVTTVHLDRLSREQTDLMISDLVGSKELPFGAREQIISNADGIPLFVEELTKAVLESGLLGVINQHDVMRNVSSSCVIPTTLLGSLTARFDKLGPSKEIAQIGAVIGREFSYRLLTEVASSDEHSLQAALSQLIASQLILVRGEPPSSAYIFKHALVQEAAYVTMLRSKRQQLHSRIADALIVGFPDTVEKQPELIAHHLAEAGLAERAIEYLQKAGRRAIERSANTEAIGQLTRARELLQSLPSGVEGGRAALGLEVMLGQAMIADRGYAATETRETLLRAKMLINDSTNPSHKFAVLYGVWACLYVGGEVSKQLEAATEFLSEAERQSDTGVLCIAHRILGTTYVTTGEFARGLHQLERAQALYASEHHLHYRHQYGQDIGAATLCYLSWALWHLGYVDQASAVAADAVKHAEELSHPHTLVYTLCHARGFMDLFRQHHEDIQSYTGLVNSLCTENRFSHWKNCGRVLEGWAEVCQGNVDQGIALLRTGMAAWQKAGAHLWLPMFLTLEAKACAKSGRAEAALEAIEKAIAISKDTGERWMMPEVLRVKARLLQATGRAEAGQIETILCHSLKIARAQRARCWELRASCDLARLWQGQNRIEEALQVLQSIYDQFTEGFDKPDLRNARALVENLRRSAGLKAGDGAGKKSDETKRRKSFLLSADRDNATGNP